jgi:hypothetical protein
MTEVRQGEPNNEHPAQWLRFSNPPLDAPLPLRHALMTAVGGGLAIAVMAGLAAPVRAGDST